MANDKRRKTYIKYACSKAYDDGYAKALKDFGLDSVNKVIEILKNK